MVGVGEVKKTIATAIAAAFGFIIALIWKEVIVGLFSLMGLTMSAIDSWTGAIIAVISAVIITVVCVLGILFMSKWGEGKK